MSARLPRSFTEHPAVAVMRLLPAVSPTGTVALALVVLSTGLLPVGFMLSVGALAGAVTGSGARMWPAFWWLAAVWLAAQVARTAQALLTEWLGHRVTEHTAGLVLAAGVAPVGIGHLEDPATADRFEVARGVGTETLPPGTAVAALADLAGTRVRAVATAVTLTAVLWWAAVPLAIGWALFGARMGRGLDRQLTGLRRRTEVLRRAGYLRSMALGQAEAKEVRVFGLGGWLADRFGSAWHDGMAEVFRRDPRAGADLAARGALLVLGYLAVLGHLAVLATGHGLGVAALTVAVQAAIGMAAFGWVGDSAWLLASSAAALPAAERLRPLTTAPPARTSPRPDRGGAPGIRFESVRFGYPGRDDRPVDGLDLWLPPGTSLGVVGANGAGKSTLVKLLCRLHEPDSGRITADGVDLRELDPHTWRRRLAVVFQDFVRYELSARDNVAFGRLDALRSDGGDDALWAAAEAAGAADIVRGLPQGWDTVLSRRFGTTDLSGGQWQRLALARALFAVHHGATVLVLDEPTAHLDAPAEALLYERFLELTAGLTTVLVSHRFNTVRLADRIAVLDGGRVAEHGDHDALMALDGRYARLFRLQADRLGVTG